MRILLTGPECTGKSTLSEQLSQKLNIPWFPEYARTYLEENGPDYIEEDLLKIGQTHHHLLHSFTQDQPIILDTYLLNLVIWSESKYGSCHEWLEQQARAAHFDKILLLSPDLKWEQDGLRESEGKREELFKLFKEKLTSYSMPFHIIKGRNEERLNSALDVIKL